MFTITNGTVEYARSTRPADYEKREAKVVLTYNVDEGTDPQAAMRAVFEMAVSEVHGRVGLSTLTAPEIAEMNRINDLKPTTLNEVYPRQAVRQANPTTTSPAATTATSAGASVPSPSTSAVSVSTSVTPGPTATKAASPFDPFAIGGKAAQPKVNPTPGATTTATNASSGSPAADASAQTAPSPTSPTSPSDDHLTDQDLHVVAQTAIEKKIDPNKVRAITAKHAGAMGMTISMIPAEKRQAWLDDVKALYKS